MGLLATLFKNTYFRIVLGAAFIAGAAATIQANQIPWLGVGAVLAGSGSLLTGYAALVTANKGGEIKNGKTTIEVNGPGSE